MKVTIRPNDDKVVLTMTTREFRNLVDTMDTAALADQSFRWTLGGPDGKATEDFTHHRGRTLETFLRRLGDAFGFTHFRNAYWGGVRGTRDLGPYNLSEGYYDDLSRQRMAEEATA